VSPCLLRPLRTLDQVLDGRGSAIERRPERVKPHQPCNSRDPLCEIAEKESVPPA
jgi:hypothetical protein